jgi:hypothetical protein
MQELQLLNDKLDMLLKKYAVAEAENKRLRDTVSYQQHAIGLLNEKLAGIEHNMAAVQMGKGVFDDKEKEGMRKQLDNVIGEIDKILNTLND